MSLGMSGNPSWHMYQVAQLKNFICDLHAHACRSPCNNTVSAANRLHHVGGACFLLQEVLLMTSQVTRDPMVPVNLYLTLILDNRNCNSTALISVRNCNVTAIVLVISLNRYGFRVSYCYDQSCDDASSL